MRVAVLREVARRFWQLVVAVALNAALPTVVIPALVIALGGWHDARETEA